MLAQAKIYHGYNYHNRELEQKASEARPAPEAKNAPVGVILLAIAGIVALLFIYLAQCAALVSSQYKLCSLKDTKASLERQKSEYQLKVENLSSLERIEKIALKLGMIKPEKKVVLDLNMINTPVEAEVTDTIAVK